MDQLSVTKVIRGSNPKSVATLVADSNSLSFFVVTTRGLVWPYVVPCHSKFPGQCRRSVKETGNSPQLEGARSPYLRLFLVRVVIYQVIFNFIVIYLTLNVVYLLAVTLLHHCLPLTNCAYMPEFTVHTTCFFCLLTVVWGQ